MCLNIWAWSRYFSICTWITMQACLKKAGVKLELITDFDMLLMVEKGFGGRMCHAIVGTQKQIKHL